MNWMLGHLPIVGFGSFLLRSAHITFGPTSFLQVWVIVSATLDSPLQGSQARREIINDRDKEAVLGAYSHWWSASEEDENFLRTSGASNDLRCSICLPPSLTALSCLTDSTDRASQLFWKLCCVLQSLYAPPSEAPTGGRKYIHTSHPNLAQRDVPVFQNSINPQCFGLPASLRK
ncbi:hypothetical protein BJY00DRAFT_105808 [Aspergillus carlsbadensis]|nr:hypothetical protein BJY00DRAFT_105808 [Aspergillus carlsbadensis]